MDSHQVGLLVNNLINISKRWMWLVILPLLWNHHDPLQFIYLKKSWVFCWSGLLSYALKLAVHPHSVTDSKYLLISFITIMHMAYYSTTVVRFKLGVYSYSTFQWLVTTLKLKVSKLIDFVKHIVHIGVVDTAEQELSLIFCNRTVCCHFGHFCRQNWEYPKT